MGDTESGIFKKKFFWYVQKFHLLLFMKTISMFLKWKVHLLSGMQSGQHGHFMLCVSQRCTVKHILIKNCHVDWESATKCS